MAVRSALVEPDGIVGAIVFLDGDVPEGSVAVPCAAGTGVVAGWLWDGSQFVEPTQLVVPPKTVFDGVEFLGRLTDDEYSAIIAASAKSVQLARWLDIFRLRGEIDVTGSTAQAAKVGLVATGLLTQERADVIFASG